MSESRKSEFILWHPNRCGSIRVFADKAVDFGDRLELRDGPKVVAVSAPLGLAVDAEALVPKPAHLIPPPPPAMRAVKAVPGSVRFGSSPSWPFLAGLALGALGGVLGMLVFAFV